MRGWVRNDPLVCIIVIRTVKALGWWHNRTKQQAIAVTNNTVWLLSCTNECGARLREPRMVGVVEYAKQLCAEGCVPSENPGLEGTTQDVRSSSGVAHTLQRCCMAVGRFAQQGGLPCVVLR